MKKPSDLKNIFPFDSVFQNYDDEAIMQQLVTLLANYKNTWGMTHMEYCEMQGNDRLTEEYFKRFEPYLKSADTVILFSSAYKL